MPGSWREAVKSTRKRRRGQQGEVCLDHTTSRTMNLALIDPFQLAQDYPDVLIDDLSKSSSHLTEGERPCANLWRNGNAQTDPTRTESGHATTIRFNRKGDYLASGRSDGKVVIW